MVSGAHFISSTGISSYPGLLFGFILAIIFHISSAVKGIGICDGSISLIGCLFL